MDDGGNPPRIRQYAGRGPLRTWLRMAATRQALNFREEERVRSRSVDELDELARPVLDPELRLVKAEAHGHFKAAFAAALSELEATEQNVLRLQILDGLSIDEIGRVYGVHRATAARWLVKARERLLERTKTLLHERLADDSLEVNSLIRMVESQMDVSLIRLLRDGVLPPA
jgi:RNA polymerase sigma-70 factor (ECF subfamily)